MNIDERLAQLRSGMLREAEDDTYQLTEPEEPDDTANDDPVTPDEANPSENDSTDADPSPDQDEPATSDTMDTPNTSSDIPKNQSVEILKLNPGSRAILLYKNYRQYLDLLEEIEQIIYDTSELETSNSTVREIMKKVLDTANELKRKITDYMVYRYQSRSYEENFVTYTNFLVEKKLIDDITQQIHNQTYERS